MKLTGQQKVHIAPMGYELDRIDLALQDIGADRVYLIINENEGEKGRQYLRELERRITAYLPRDRIQILECPFWDFQSIMSLLCELARREKHNGNFVYINLSSGSKLSAVAGTLASLMYGAIPYYVRPEKYSVEDPPPQNGQIVSVSQGLKEILQIPPYTIETPPDELISALGILVNNNGKMKQKDYILAMEEHGLLKDVTEKHRSRTDVTKKGYARAKRQYFEKLEDRKWIEKTGRGRASYFHITDEGENTYRTFKDAVAVIRPRHP